MLMTTPRNRLISGMRVKGKWKPESGKWRAERGDAGDQRPEVRDQRAFQIFSVSVFQSLNFAKRRPEARGQRSEAQGVSDAKVVFFECYDSSPDECFRVALQYVIHRWRLEPGGDFDKANNPFMRCAMQENEFAKIFVERDQNAIFSNCDIEDFFVAGIGCKVACPPYIMPEFSELFRRRTPNAGVEKKSHAALGIGMGNIVSLETAARAYSRQARMSSRSSHG